MQGESIKSFTDKINAAIAEYKAHQKTNDDTDEQDVSDTMAESLISIIKVDHNPDFLDQYIPPNGFLLATPSMIICAKELLWHEKATIEYNAIQHFGDEIYANDEYILRAVLQKAVLWVYDHKTKTFHDGIQHLSEKSAEQIWLVYMPYYALDEAKVQSLMTMCDLYFENQLEAPPHPILLEYAALSDNLFTMTRADFMGLTALQYESLQVVLLAKSKFQNPTQ